MPRQWTILGLILSGTALSFWLASSPEREPVHAGKKVTQWLDAGYEDCANALQEIGPPALPFILTHFGGSEPWSGRLPSAWRSATLRRWNFFRKTPACNLDEDRVCSLTLELGPGTIPILARELENRRANVRSVSARALSLWRDQGKDIRVAVPWLNQALNDPSPRVRMWSARALRVNTHLASDEFRNRAAGPDE